MCGNIVIDKFPAGMSSELRVKTIKIRKESGEEYQTVTSDANGQFCANCQPGKYAFSVKFYSFVSGFILFLQFLIFLCDN